MGGRDWFCLQVFVFGLQVQRRPAGLRETSEHPTRAGVFSGRSTPNSRVGPFLQVHPNQILAAYLQRGIVNGFRIGFDRSQGNFLYSANDNPTAADRYVLVEVQSGRLWPVAFPSAAHCSLIPKAHRPGTFHMIIDLPVPQGFSVNKGVDPVLCSLE